MCWKCKVEQDIAKPGFRDLCLQCGKDLHVCKNCRFYKPGVYRDCAETVPEAVTDKERGNFCEYFQLNPLVFKPRAAVSPKPDPREDFDKLFGGS